MHRERSSYVQTSAYAGKVHKLGPYGNCLAEKQGLGRLFAEESLIRSLLGYGSKHAIKGLGPILLVRTCPSFSYQWEAWDTWDLPPLLSELHGLRILRTSLLGTVLK